MASSPTYMVCLVPRDFAGPNDLLATTKAFRDLRLQALASDPASFSSSDLVERQKPLSFWTSRLQNPHAKTFALVCSHDDGLNVPESNQMVEDTWHGMLVVLGPQVVDTQTYDNKLSWRSHIGEKEPRSQDLENESPQKDRSPPHMALSYHVVAVYISKHARGKGLGRELFEAASEAIQDQAKEMGATKAICTLGVEKELVAAWKLYTDMGFVAVAEDDYVGDDGREIHDTIMRRDFAVNSLE